MLAEVHGFIAEHQLIRHGEKILLAISGGIDSMVMAHLFLHLPYETGIAHLTIIFMPESGRKVADKLRAKSREVAEMLKHRRQEISEISEETEDYLDSLVERDAITQSRAQELKKMIDKFIKSK
jgi:tRNA(Ile)-lysidine synthase TilS/MesJ